MNKPNKANFAVVYFKILVYGIFYSLSSYVFLRNLRPNNENSWLLCVIIVAVWVLKCCNGKKVDELGRWLKSAIKQKPVYLTILGVGCILRLFPLFIGGGETYSWILQDNQGDCAIHFFGAQQLAFDGRLTDINAWYESIFPYLFSYTAILANFVRLFRDITRAVVLSNLLFDAISAYFLVKLLRLLKKEVAIGFVFWWLNPFFIAMCWLPMAIIVVNTVLMIAVYLGYVLQQKIALGKYAVLNSALFGIAVFVGNLFRPLFYVVLIAETIILGIFAIKSKKRMRIIISISIMMVCVFIPSQIYSSFLTEIGGHRIPDNGGAWSFYVGSNYESSGKWSAQDSNYYISELLQIMDASEAGAILFEQGIQRYMSMSVYRFVKHIFNKVDVLFADVGNAIYDLEYSFLHGKELRDILKIIIEMYYILLLGMIVIRYRRIREYVADNADVFLSILLFVGCSCAYMLVEVMNRYVSMILPLQILILCDSFYEKEMSTSSEAFRE